MRASVFGPCACVFFRGVVWGVGLCGLWFVCFLVACVLGVGLCVAGGMSAPSQCDVRKMQGRITFRAL